MNNRLGNIDDLPLALKKQLRNKAAKPGPEARVIDALKALDGIATTDELMVKQYRLFKLVPESRRHFQNLLCRMQSLEMIAREGSGVWKLLNTTDEPRRKASDSI